MQFKYPQKSLSRYRLFLKMYTIYTVQLFYNIHASIIQIHTQFLWLLMLSTLHIMYSLGTCTPFDLIGNQSLVYTVYQYRTICFSAGIGRTGTFIALDYLIKQGQRDGSVDVVSCVSRMRHQRAHAIQTVVRRKIPELYYMCIVLHYACIPHLFTYSA